MTFDEVKQYERLPFDVDAVRVSEENLEHVADWCGGDIRTEKKRQGDVRFIKVRVYKALDEEQTKAYVGNWVLYAGSGYKVYTNNAFNRTFRPKSKVTITNEPAGLG